MLAELQAFYRAFAYQPVTEEPPDHVAVQAGFVGYLKLKQAFARACAERDAADVVRWAAERFQLPRLLAITEAENAPSRRTLERAEFIHESDTVMVFQGSEQTVSRYLWHPDVRS